VPEGFKTVRSLSFLRVAPLLPIGPDPGCALDHEHCSPVIWSGRPDERIRVWGRENIYSGCGRKGAANKHRGIAEGQGTRMAQLDPSSGNYFYAGIHPGDFCSLGVNYTNSACFLAKFSSAGNLIWSVNFGPIGCLRNIGITDIRIDSAGTIYVGYDWNVSTTSHVPTAAAFDASGRTFGLQHFQGQLSLPLLEALGSDASHRRVGLPSSLMRFPR